MFASTKRVIVSTASAHTAPLRMLQSHTRPVPINRSERGRWWQAGLAAQRSITEKLDWICLSTTEGNASSEAPALRFDSGARKRHEQVIRTLASVENGALRLNERASLAAKTTRQQNRPGSTLRHLVPSLRAFQGTLN